jgi:hypothetical protein
MNFGSPDNIIEMIALDGVAKGIFGAGTWAYSKFVTQADDLLRIKGINPTGSTCNCGKTAEATVRTLQNGELVAAADGRMTVEELEAAFNGKFYVFDNLGGVASEMRAAGTGAKGIITAQYIEDGLEHSHVFVVKNNYGVMSFLDGQSEALANSKGMYNFQLMIVEGIDPIADAALVNTAQSFESVAVSVGAAAGAAE